MNPKNTCFNNLNICRSGRSFNIFVGVLLFIVAIVMCWIGNALMKQFSFTSDGFHYYSAIRNIANGASCGFGAWEGPTFEFLFGNHTYFTLAALVPFVYVFKSPAVMLSAGIVAHVAMTWGVFLCCRAIRGDSVALPVLFSLLAILFPLSLGMVSGGIYLFQPDSLLAPGIAMLILGFIRLKVWRVVTAVVLIVLTKEESK